MPLKTGIPVLQGGEDVNDTIDTLRAQLAEAQRDSERLDWMIEQCAYVVSDPDCCDLEARQASAFRPGKESAKPVRASLGATDQSAAVAQEHQPCELFPIARA